MTIKIPYFLLTFLALNFPQIDATFGGFGLGGGGGGGCSCAPAPTICPSEPVVCAPQVIGPTPVVVGPAPVVQVAPPPPPVQVVQIPMQVPTNYVIGGGCSSGFIGGGGGCSGGCGYSSYGGGGSFDYYPPYPCSSCKRAHRREFIKRKLAKNRLRRVKRAASLMKVNSDGNFAGNSGNSLKSGSKKRRKQDSKCNSEKLKMIMKKAVGMKSSTLKKNIQMLVEKMLGSQYNVLCGKGEFSYTTTTDEYCQTQVMDRTCYVFRRNTNSDDEDQETEDYDEPHGN